MNGVKSRYVLIEPSDPKRGKTRYGAANFLEFPTEIPDYIRTDLNQMKNVQETGLTDLENQFKQAEFVFCHLVNIR